jgi:hypothetical protein
MSKTKTFSKKSKGGKQTRKRKSIGGDIDGVEQSTLNTEVGTLVGGGLLLLSVGLILGLTGKGGSSSHNTVL